MPIVRQQALHRKAVTRDIDPTANLGGRQIKADKILLDYRRLDALSRTRALSLKESFKLEECVRELDRRAEWRELKRKQREARA